MPSILILCACGLACTPTSTDAPHAGSKSDESKETQVSEIAISASDCVFSREAANPVVGGFGVLDCGDFVFHLGFFVPIDSPLAPGGFQITRMPRRTDGEWFSYDVRGDDQAVKFSSSVIQGSLTLGFRYDSAGSLLDIFLNGLATLPADETLSVVIDDDLDFDFLTYSGPVSNEPCADTPPALDALCASYCNEVDAFVSELVTHVAAVSGDLTDEQIAQDVRARLVPFSDFCAAWMAYRLTGRDPCGS